MSTPTKEQSSQNSTGSLDITKLLDELEIPSRSQNSISSSVLLVKKLLQFDKSPRPAYYGTWRKKRYSPAIMCHYTWISLFSSILLKLNVILREYLA
jgi:hypothetical protein